MGGGRAEQGEQRVAEEFVDEAAEGLHRVGQFLEELVLQCLHDLRVEPLAQGGEAAEVGEQHRDGAPIGVAVGPAGIGASGSRRNRLGGRLRCLHG